MSLIFIKQYEGMGLNVKGVDGSELFLNNLKGESDPEAKRKAIGNTFIDVFDEESQKIKELNGWHKGLFTQM